MIKLVLVDDHELVRAGFRLVLQQQPDMQVVGEAGSAEQGLRLIRDLKPDVALVDVHMPGMSGIELTMRVARARLPTQIVVLAVLEDARSPKRLIEAGALGYLSKACASDELLAAVRHVAQGRRYLAPAVARQLVLATLDGTKSPFDALSGRELEVALLLVRGEPVFAIAGLLQLSPTTISTYKQRLLDKLGMDNVISLAHLMSAHGLIDQQSSGNHDLLRTGVVAPP